MTSLQLGQSASYCKVITKEDIRAFAEITGDFNPLHVDDEYARQACFGGPIAHGMLTAGLISAVLGNQLPGPGAIYLSQSLSFRQPVYPGDSVTALVEVTGIRPDKPVVTLATKCINQKGELVLDGEAVLLLSAASAI